ncbi:hypothetical protein CSA08_02495, partial [Candidatus Gracilibacteria bacterium]
MKIIKIFIKLLLITFLTLFFGKTYAASIDHFEVTMNPSTAKTGETIDITIEAVDVDNNTITDYKGSILVFSESDPEADFPSVLKENSYTFKASDEGKIKFENAVRFQTIGVQDIHVYELENETVVGIAEVEIVGEDTVNNAEIEIISPETGITIGENKIMVSGMTNKNYNVKIKLNNELEFESTSNGEGIFEKEIRGLKQGANSIYAEIIDADGNVLGKSSEVNVRVESNKPRIKNLTITPNGEVKSEEKLELEIVSNVGLSEVNVIINDILIKLEEKGEGIYRATTSAPKEPGNYSVDTVLKDEIGNETKELGVEIITVLENKESAKEPKKESEPVKKEETKPVVKQNEVITTCTKDTKVTGLKLTKLKTKSVLNWNKVKDASKYNVYKKLSNGEIELVKTVEEPVFTIDIVGDE